MRQLLFRVSMRPLLLGVVLLGAAPSRSHGGWPWYCGGTTYSGAMTPVVAVAMPPAMVGVAGGSLATTSSTPPPYSSPMAPVYPGYAYPGTASPGSSYPGYAYPGYTYPGYATAGYTYPGYAYPGSSHPAYAAPNSPQAPAPPGGTYSYLADFDANTAPIVAPIPGSSAPLVPGLTSLGVQILGDLAYQWFSGMASDKNGLFQNALSLFRQRTNQSASAQPSSTDLQKLAQMVERVIATVTRGGVGAATGGAVGPGGPASAVNPGASATATGSASHANPAGGDVLSFTVTAPAGAGITGISFQYGSGGASSVPQPQPTPGQPGSVSPAPQPVNPTTPSGPPGNH